MDATVSTMDRAFDGCYGAPPDGVTTVATWASRPLPCDATRVGDPVGDATVVMWLLGGADNAEEDVSQVVTSLQVRFYQGQPGGGWPAGPLINVPVPAGGGKIVVNAPIAGVAINRFQAYLTTGQGGNALKGLAVLVISG